ncbi:hypothetical protein B6U91_00450 [Candidatus Pacearchaeota archaeon ex4484_71]|nr:MAG: hypothetical protein B6U91_00450 [Candidatus Pacearchaeota archaeon ex4484_71]
MPINVNDPEYVKAEKEFHSSKNLEEKLSALNKMISHAPSHKGAENLRQQLTTRRKKLEALIEKKKKSGKSKKEGIRKGDMQVVIVGFTNSGKSSLLKSLTNASPKISPHRFTTSNPEIGIIEHEGTQIQLIENPAIEGEFFDRGLLNSADTTILLVEKIEDIKKIKEIMKKTSRNEIIVLNKTDLLTPEQKRKTSATLQSKRYNFCLISSIKELRNNNLEELKKIIFDSFNILRIFTKEPGKDIEKSKQKPMILKPGATVKDVAEKILKGLSKRIKETKIWGPSSKFGGQKVGLTHKVKDLDIVEFKTK